MKTYPRIGDVSRLPKPTDVRKCAMCANKATHKVAIQVNWFRGDDEACFACDEHRKGDGKTELMAAFAREFNGAQNKVMDEEVQS